MSCNGSARAALMAYAAPIRFQQMSHTGTAYGPQINVDCEAARPQGEGGRRHP
jgi:hypothetical protein